MRQIKVLLSWRQ